MRKKEGRKGKGESGRVRLLSVIMGLQLSLTGCGLFAIEVTSAQKETSGAESSAVEASAAGGREADSTDTPVTDAQGDSREDMQSGGIPVEMSVPEEASAGAVEAEPEIELLMVGDILLHTPLAESGKTASGTYDFSAVFAPLQEEISGADLALVNQEVIIGGAELGVSGYPAFNAPYELGDALMTAGFDVVCHATNHALDKGKRGLQNCLAFWEESYPETAVLGIYGSEEDSREIYVYEQEGIRIAILNYTYGTNGIPLPGDMPYAVKLLERERVQEELQRAEELADFVVVCPHWGTEYVLEETSVQQDWAEFFAQNGADLILGTHPHVIEPIEWVGDTLVYYSLGNFVNWTSGTGKGVANRMVGGVAKVTVGRDESGEVCIRECGVEPVVCHLEKGFGGVTVYPLEQYTEELAQRNAIVGQDGDFTLEYCRQLVQEVFGSWADSN